MNTGKQIRAVVYSDYTISLPEAVQKKYNITCLSGSILNLHHPGVYKYPDMSKLQKAEDLLCDWWIPRDLLKRNSKYHLKFKDNFGKLARLVIPLDIPDKLMQVLEFSLGWSFQHDDIMDNVKDLRTGEFAQGFSTVQAASKVFCDILRDKYGRDHVDNFPSIDFPLFKPLCHTWRDIHALLHTTIPHYGSRNFYFLKYTEEYFNSYEMSHRERIDWRFSEESGKYWLRLTTGFKGWIELVNLIRGVDIPLDMRKDFYYIRLRAAGEDVIALINDIFGITKDLHNDERDTLVMFKHIEKGIPLAKAYKETVDFLNDQLKDIMILIEILRQKYLHDPNAEGYLRGLEDLIDGYIIWCGTCKRYGGQTTVTSRVVPI